MRKCKNLYLNDENPDEKIILDFLKDRNFNFTVKKLLLDEINNPKTEDEKPKNDSVATPYEPYNKNDLEENEIDANIGVF
ncbi:MAG: hypothetical protein ACRDD7_00360 [Peptostreptococcaceae bacterium]